MKRIAILLTALVLCIVMVLGVVFSPLMQSESPAAASSAVTSISSENVSLPPEEPVLHNNDLPMTDLAVDLHRIPSSILHQISPYEASWQALCDVLGEEETKFTFASSEEKGILLDTLGYLSYASAFTVTDTGLDITVHYADTYAEDCLLLAAVTESILAENVYASANELETALILYTYLTTNVELDNSKTAIFDVFNQYKGSAATLTGAFCFLLEQFDIPTEIVKTNRTTLAAAKINGQCLYFSIADEIKKEDARGLSCFGMSEEAAKLLCGDFTTPAFADACSPYALGDVFADCTDWRLDATTHYLYLAYGSSEFTTAISTVDLAEAHG